MTTDYEARAFRAGLRFAARISRMFAEAVVNRPPSRDVEIDGPRGRAARADAALAIAAEIEAAAKEPKQ